MKHEIKLPFYLAWQAIKRGRKWTLFLTIFLMSVAFINLIFVSSLFNGIIEGSNRQIIDTLTSNIYLTPKSGETTIKNPDDLIEEISKIENVEEIATASQLPARIEKNGRSGRWPVVAIDPKEYNQVFDLSGNLYKGAYLEPADTEGIVIGRQIAGGDNLKLNSTSLKGVEPGDRVNVVFDGIEKEFTVRGIYYYKFIESDSKAFVTEKAIEKISPALKDNVTSIYLKTSDDASPDKIISEIGEIQSDNDVFTWEEAAGLMKSVSSSFTSINILMTLVGTIIAAVTTFIVIYVDVVNRRRQIGILRAIGIKPYIIVLNYVILAGVYAIMGIILGSLIYQFGLVPYFIAHPFELPITDAVLDITWIEYIARVETVIFVALISGLIPALIVTRAKMLDAILGK